MRGSQTYCFAIRGFRVDQLAELIEPIGIRNKGDQTLLTAVIVDQSQLRGVLDRIADLGLQLVGLERLGPAPPPSATRTNER